MERRSPVDAESSTSPRSARASALPVRVASSWTFRAVEPVDSTCISRLPSRYTVTPLQSSE